MAHGAKSCLYERTKTVGVFLCEDCNHVKPKDDAEKKGAKKKDAEKKGE